jgi:hypothetical protein
MRQFIGMAKVLGIDLAGIRRVGEAEVRVAADPPTLDLDAILGRLIDFFGVMT